MANPATAPRGLIMQKYYVYDPGVAAGDELSRFRVRDDGDGKGLFILAPMMGVQYWIDQGLLGSKPLGEISGAAKKLLAQITRGRSERPDDTPRRPARLDKLIQSGAPAFAAMSTGDRLKKKRAMNKKGGKKPEAKARPAAPSPKPAA